MAKLKAELKRVLAAFARQDAADYLAEHDKDRVLDVDGAVAAASARSERAAMLRRRKRIALVTDGRGTGAPMAYAADACQRHEAGLDILLHGTARHRTGPMKRAARRLGIDPRVVELAGDDVEMLEEYIWNHPSLVYLVGISDDGLIRVLAERVVPARGGRMHVPLVMIEDKPTRNVKLMSTGSL